MKTLFTRIAEQCRSYSHVLLLASCWLLPLFAQAQSTTVVISEVYAGGGSTGATYQNDFVELYNKTGGSIALAGYSVQYNPASGGGPYSVVPLGNVSIPAYGYLLVQLGGGTNGGPLPTPDVVSSLNLAATSGRVALVNTTAPLQDADPANAAGVVDLLGYGSTATTYEGSGPALGMASLVSLERKARTTSTSTSMAAGGDDVDQGNGYDSNDNAADFVTRSPEPQNAGSASEVFTPNTVYYNTKNPMGALNELATFSSTMDGTGPSPASFNGGFQTFNVAGSTLFIGGNWTVTGAGSKVVELPNSTFTVPVAYNFTGVLDLGSAATLVVRNAAPAITYGSVDATSTIEFAQAGDYKAPILPGPGYGNLILRDAAKHLSTGTTVVRGNLLVSNVGTAVGDVFGGAPASSSVLRLGGSLKLAGTVKFSPTGDDRIALVATSTTAPQVLDGGGNALKLYKVTLPSGQAGLSLAPSNSSLELGNASGGGYQLATGTVFTINDNTLSFAVAGGASIDTGSNFLGQLDLSAGASLLLSKSSTTSIGRLLLTPTSTQITNLTLDLAGTGTVLSLPNSLTVTGTLSLSKGTLSIGGGNVLTLNGPLNTAAGILRGDYADLVIGGSGPLGLLRTVGGVTGSFRILTLNRASQTLTLGNDLRITNALTLQDGVLDMSGSDIFLDGSISTTATGLVRGAAQSSLRIGSTGPLGTLGFTSSGGILNQLILNRPFGRLTLAGGAIQVGATTLANGVLALGPDVALTINGALTVADPTVARFAGTPSSILNFTGSGTIGDLAFVAGQNVLQGLTLARNANATAPTGLLVTSLTVNNLTLTRGRLFVQDGVRLTVLPGGGLVGGGPNSYINKLTQSSVTNLTTPTVALNYPLGVDGEYRPLTFTVTDQVIGTTTYTAQQIEARPTTRALPGTLLRVSALRYYNVVRESGNSTLQSATIRLSYVPSADLTNTGNNNLLRIAMADPANNGRWADIGGTGSGTDITSNPFPAGPLGDFILATDINTPNNNNPLPVELSAFVAQRQASQAVSVRWTTASEKNSDRFEVQRSLNGRDFVTVATAKGQGNSSQTTAYAALDQKAPAAELYYRLRQVDHDGTQAYSPVLRVGAVGAALELALYPNPATDRLTATAPALAARTYRVLNTLGQVLDQGSAEAENPAVDVRALPAGTYLLELNGAGGRQARRFVKTN